MSIARARIANGLQCAVRGAGLRASTRTRMVVGRRYASGGGHGHGEPSSDIPWLIGAVAVTIPASWYLWPSPSHADHGHHDAHDKHDDSHAEEAEEPEKEEKEGDAEESKEDSSSEDKAEKSDSGDEKSEDDDKPEEDSEDKSEAKSAGKGKTKSGKEDSRKVEDDSKGANKKRIDSGLGKDLGDESKAGDAATAKSSQKGKEGDIGGKQHGLSNTSTRHSAPDEQLNQISSKGEGTPETAKSMGTVDPKRPQK